ncbi:MAG: TetR/AcrR family transcriptional regulator [Pseudomonadota bacterium]
MLDALADAVLANGLDAASLRPLAKAVGTSDRMLLYYFADKTALLTATFDRVLARLMPLLDAQTGDVPETPDRLRRRIGEFVLDEALWPYMRLWLEIAARAASGDPLYRDVGGRMGRGFRDWIEAQLAIEDPDTRRRATARLFATIEGMVLLNALGLDEISADAR